MADGCVTRAVTFTLDPSPAQVRMLHNYCGAARFSFNWALRQVKANLATRATEREAGTAEAVLTPAVSWSAYSLRKQFNVVKTDVAPWWRETAKHSFDTSCHG
jgi:putative transposase